MHCCCNITGLDVVVVSQPKTGIHAAISLVLIECNCSGLSLKQGYVHVAAISLVLIECNCSDCELISVLSISYTIFKTS